jgi:hypothetical protein
MWQTAAILDKTETAESDYMRRCLQFTRENEVKNERIRDRMGVAYSITKRLEN